MTTTQNTTTRAEMQNSEDFRQSSKDNDGDSEDQQQKQQHYQFLQSILEYFRALHSQFTNNTMSGARGAFPDGWEQAQLVYVYARKSKETIKNTAGMKQAIWKDSFPYVQNPQEIWAFDEKHVPDSLLKSSHPYGIWGYKPGVSDPSRCAPEEMWFYPPKAKAPSNFTPRGKWSFPVRKRDISGIAPEKAGFLNIGTATKSEKLDVGGTWRMLYQRDGEPKGPGMKPPMQIHVQKPTGHILTLQNVQPTDTIGQIKTRILEQTGIPFNEQRLHFMGRPLDADQRTLDECGIENNDTLVLAPMVIYVKDIKRDAKYTLQVEPRDTILDVKDCLESEQDIPKRQQRLTYKGKLLMDKPTIRDYGIPHEGILQLEPMQIHVKTPKGKTITLDVDPTDRIKDIKKQVEAREGTPVDEQRLLFDDRELADKPTLDDFGIQHGDTLNLEPMKIYVRTPQGKKMAFNVKPSNRISDIKQMVEDHKDGIPQDEQRLLQDGKELDNDRATLKDCKIKHGDILDLEPMIIYVKDVKGKKKYTLQVKPDDSISKVKQKLESQEGIPKPQQRLTFKSKPLQDKPTLRDYGVPHEGTLQLEPMQIHVKTPKGKKITLEVDPTDRIKDIKKQVEAREGTPVDEQRLLFDDRELDDKPTLDDCGIQHGDTLDLEPMIIYVMDPKGKKKYTLQVKPSDSISNVKDKLDAQEGIPKPQQRLTYQDRQLQDKPTLRDYGIPHEGVLQLEPMQIHVKTPNGKKITLDVDPTDKIKSVKKQVEDREGIPVDEQRLLFDGKELADKPTLDDFGIQHGDTLNLDPMRIHVRTPQGKRMTFKVKPTNTISDIKRMVEGEESIPPEDQRLLQDGDKPLKDDRATLKECGIQHDDVLDLEGMQIIIKDWTGNKFTLDVEPTDTIDSVKGQIEGREKIPKQNQYLLYNGNLLVHDDQTLDDYNIKHMDVVNLDRMKIYIKDWKGKTYTLMVDPTDTTKDVKKQIQQRENIPVKEQLLSFQGLPMQDPKTLDDAGVQYLDVLNLDKAFASPKKSPKPKVDEKLYTIQLSPWKGLENGYTKKEKIKREGKKAGSHELLKARYHTDFETELQEHKVAALEKQAKKKAEENK